MDTIIDAVESLDLTNNTLTNDLNNMVNVGFTLDFPHGPEIETAIATTMIGLGIALVLFGCRLFKAALFALIMTGTTALIYYIGVSQGESSKLMFAIGITLGFFCGLLAIKLWKLALFAVGAFVGLVIFVVAKNLYPGAFVTPAAEYSALILPALILGMVSVYLERWWLLVSTPVLGSFLTIQGIDHFANLDINVFGTLQGTAQCDTDECYGLWSGVAGLALFGMLIQYRYTAGFNHTKVVTVHQKEKYVKQVDSV